MLPKKIFFQNRSIGENLALLSAGPFGTQQILMTHFQITKYFAIVFYEQTGTMKITVFENKRLPC